MDRVARSYRGRNPYGPRKIRRGPILVYGWLAIRPEPSARLFREGAKRNVGRHLPRCRKGVASAAIADQAARRYIALMARSKSKNATTPEAQPPAAVEPPKRDKRAFAPTDDHRRIAEVALGMGLTQGETCQLLLNPKTGKPIDEKTLRLHFGAEILAAEAKMHFRAARSLAVLIEGRPAVYDAKGNLLRAEISISPAMVAFYHKTRRGWSETQNVNHSGAVEFTDAKSELARRIARHAGTAESEETRPANSRTH